jgi:nucleotide-binding universal stress UspA family protein
VPSAILATADAHMCDIIAMTIYARGRLGHFVFNGVANHGTTRA